MSMPTSPCGEMLGYPKLIINDKGAFSERLLKIKTADSAAWINYFFDNPYCPYFQSWGYNNPPLLLSLEFKPLPSQRIASAGSAGLASYEWGLLNLIYDGNLRVHDLTKQVVKETIETDFETITVDRPYLNWFDPGGVGSIVALPEHVGIHRPGEKYTIHFPYSSTHGTLVTPGSINSDIFTAYVLGRTFAAETLLYCGCEVNITISNSGWTRWNKMFMFKWRPVSWNLFYNASSGNYEKLQVGTTTIKPYGTPTIFSGNFV